MTTTRPTWAIIDSATDVGVLLGAARQLSDVVVALVIGPRHLVEQASSSGFSETRWLGEPAATVGSEDYAAAIAELALRETPTAALMASSTRNRLLAGRLAARLDTSALTDVSDLRTEDDTVVVTHSLYGGAALRTERLLSAIGVITISAGAFAALGSGPSWPGPIVEASCAVTPPPISLLERRSEPRSAGTLPQAKVVVGAGRGVGSRDDLGVVEELAQALGGQMACTRPLAEGLNWMGRDQYLGVSGLSIAPDLYVAVGVSGQMQHMVGVDQARVIVAINNDKAAPVFAESDYGIVGDLHQVVPALVDALKAVS
jgi:electron transfer flavoprotein alpha subunit